ncbi:MAG: plastocyanin/azurin family copper-binding protein [Thermomicrobiales bacterium]
MQVDRRRLLALGMSALVGSLGLQRAAAHDATATPTSAGPAAGMADATPVASPAASPAASGSTFVSTIVSLKFTPPEIDIEAGTTVIWENRDVVSHTVTHKAKVEDQLFASPYIEPGKSFSFTFDKPGTYPVFCIPHPFMSQTVVVTEKK